MTKWKANPADGWKIYKYTLEPTDSFFTMVQISMPRDARVLSVDAQGDDICVWAMVHTEDKTVRPRRFAVIPTGAVIPDDMVVVLDRSKFVKTVLLHNGALVFHVWSVDKDLEAGQR